MAPHEELNCLTLLLSHVFTLNITFQCGEPWINGMAWLKVYEWLLSQIFIQ